MGDSDSASEGSATITWKESLFTVMLGIHKLALKSHDKEEFS
jgi:hypothetical protein